MIIFKNKLNIVFIILLILIMYLWINNQTSVNKDKIEEYDIQPTTTQSQQPTTTQSQIPTTTQIPINSDIPKTTIAINSLMDDLLLDMKTLIRDTQSNLPIITSSQAIDLINSGANINSLIPSLSYGKPNYKFQDPATNIIEIDFDGESNIYSPYIYYDKNLSEKFDFVKKAFI